MAQTKSILYLERAEFKHRDGKIHKRQQNANTFLRYLATQL